MGLRFWLVTLAALAAAVTTGMLGAWQLSRAAEKQAMQADIDARAQMPALGNGDLLQLQPGDLGAVLHRKVVLQGQWLPDAMVYLDNRQMQGKPGFWVLAPLRLSGGQAVVLVQRGWVPRDFQERTRLPQVQTPATQVQLQGRVTDHVVRLYEFGPSAGGDREARIRQNLDVAAYAAETGLPLLPMMVLQTDDASDGLRRDWAPVNTGVDKHYGYAFQWFGLCALVVVLYVWFQFVRRFSRRGAKSRA
ncbi:SURF1 family protein [Oryzisolibacter sp. LB2S]